MENIVEKAKQIATEAHKGTFRKWTPAEYITHPTRCAVKAKEVGLNEEAQAAAYLHDVVEDCGEQWAGRIEKECGSVVLSLVRELTFPCEGPEWKDKSRAEKNAIREPQMRAMTPIAKQLKLIDSLDNVKDMKVAPRRLIEKTRNDMLVRIDILGAANPKLAQELADALKQMG